jgi:anthranilate phosphoribosyltransferase
VNLSPEHAAEALRRHRFAFLLAPSHHPAMKAFLPIRRALGVRTIFNILGPLTNPAGAQAQVMGVYAAHLVPMVAEAMALLGTRHAYVVHGTNIGPFGRDGAALAMDELSITGLSEVAEVRAGQVNTGGLSYSDFGIRHASIDMLRGGDAAENAQILRSIFAGEQGPRRDIVQLNAAAVLTAAGVAQHLGHGFQIAGETVDSGAVTELVSRLSS